MVTKTAPDLTPGYPSNGAKLGPAWAALWAELAKASRRKDPFLDGRILAEEIAPDHGLEATTLVALLSRMAKGHLLVREGRPVQVNVNRSDGSVRGSTRVRTFYRASDV